LELPDRESRVTEAIPTALNYSIQVWDAHLNGEQVDSTLYQEAERFMTTKFLFWLEALSLTEQLAGAKSSLKTLIMWCKVTNIPCFLTQDKC
jgi:hypothetical protein